MWIDREIEPILIKTASQRPALILTGYRQAGKTSLFKKCFPQHHFVSLDLPIRAQEAEESGDEFLKTQGEPLIIDEVQYAPNLFRYLKVSIDQKRDHYGRYCLTGSQKFSLMEEVTESLGGRAAILECHSLSHWELEKWSGKTAEGTQLLEWILKGGYPELHTQELDPERFFSDYVSTYLERDVRQIIQVRNLRDFNRFMRLAALRTGPLLSLSSFASDLGRSPNTIKKWLSVLEASNIILLLEPYFTNLGNRVIKTPKLYFLDTGLASYLCGIHSSNELRSTGLLGALFETHVVGQMVRWYSNRGRKPEFYFYRDHYGHEVDFVIPVGRKLKLFECKFSESPSEHVRGFEEIEKLVGSENILSRNIISSARGMRKTNKNNMTISDSVELKILE